MVNTVWNDAIQHIIDSLDIHELGQTWEMVRDRKAWCAQSMESQRVEDMIR